MNIRSELYSCIGSLINRTYNTPPPEIQSEQLCEYYSSPSGKEHYKLLAYLSTFVEGTIYDIGTYKGLSAIALSFNQSNKVISYDIENHLNVQCPENVVFRIGDFHGDPELLNSPLILFDIDPHNGEKEKQFIQYLVDKQYKGVVIFDDIYYNDDMTRFWNQVEQEKVDLTGVGHWSGTGAVVFN